MNDPLRALCAGVELACAATTGHRISADTSGSSDEIGRTIWVLSTGERVTVGGLDWCSDFDSCVRSGAPVLRRFGSEGGVIVG